MSALPEPAAGPILFYVEDDDNATFFFRLCLQKLQPGTTLIVVETCQKALNFLHRRKTFEEAPRPHLVVLDLHLPDGTGFDILENIRCHETLAGLPVVFFSTSVQAAHRKRAGELGALGFFPKPAGLDEFEQAVGKIHDLVPLAA